MNYFLYLITETFCLNLFSFLFSVFILSTGYRQTERISQRDNLYSECDLVQTPNPEHCCSVFHTLSVMKPESHIISTPDAGLYKIPFQKQCSRGVRDQGKSVVKGTGGQSVLSLITHCWSLSMRLAQLRILEKKKNLFTLPKSSGTKS